MSGNWIKRSDSQKGRRLSVRLLIYILLFSSLITLIGTSVQLYMDFRYDVSLVERRLDAVKESYLTGLGRSLWDMNDQQTRAHGNGIQNLPDVAFVTITRETGELIFAGGNQQKGQVISRSFKISPDQSKAGSKVLGALYVEVPLGPLYQRLKNRALVILATQAIKIFLVSFFILFVFHLLVTKRIEVMADGLGKLNLQDPVESLAFDKTPEFKEPDELDQMGGVIDQMHRRLAAAYQEIDQANHDLEATVARRTAEVQEIALFPEQNHNPIFRIKADGEILYANTSAKKMVESLGGEKPLMQEWQFLAKQALAQDEASETEITADFQVYNLVFVPVGEKRYVNVYGNNITERKAAEERLQFLANHDTLTGLPTRRLVMDHIANAMALARRNRTKAALLFLDLDDFKQINDSLGHEVGDKLLIEAGNRLKQTVREVDTVARLGGDEFIVLLANIERSNDAALVAEKLVNTLSQPYDIEGNQISGSASIGIAVYPDHAEEPEGLIQKADTAMYEVKHKAKNGYIFTGE